MQIRRRRGTVDPVTASYDAILATDPTVPLLFRLTSYRGQQVLFQDAACTIPVESIGDPIGGVRHPLTGEIIAVQTVDADRPVWGGESVGAVFDGISNKMFLGARIEDTRHTVSYSGLIWLEESIDRSAILGRETSASFAFVMSTASDGRDIRNRYSGGDNANTLIDSHLSLIGNKRIVTTRKTDTSTDIFVDGDFAGTSAVTDDNPMGCDQIMATGNISLGGEMESIIIHNSALLEAQISGIYEALL